MREQDQDFEPYVPPVMVWRHPGLEDRQAARDLIGKHEAGQIVHVDFSRLKPSRHDLPGED